MSGGNEIDVMAANLLKFDHDVRQIFICNFLPLAFMGDRPVLAENTAQVAVGEEDGARTAYSRYRFFFTKMGVGAENDGAEWGTAEPLLALLPIHSTSPRAELAML